MCLDFDGHHSGGSSFDMTFGFCYKMWAITHRYWLAFKKKKKSSKEPQSWSRVSKTGSDPSFGLGRDMGCDTTAHYPPLPCL